MATDAASTSATAAALPARWNEAPDAKDKAFLLLLRAAALAQSRGAFNLEEAEVLSQAVRLLSADPREAREADGAGSAALASPEA